MVSVPELEGKQTALFFKLCSDHLSIEAIPRVQVSVDFQRFKHETFREHELMMWTPHFVVLKNAAGQEITLRKNGRMLVRKAETEQIAQDAATKVMSMVLKEFAD